MSRFIGITFHLSYKINKYIANSCFNLLNGNVLVNSQTIHFWMDMEELKL